MSEPHPLEFAHRGHQVRVERRRDGWAVLLDGTLIDRVPPYENTDRDEGGEELERIAKRAVNQHLEGRTPGGI